ncbi:Os06g0621700 [Oryza sativa Japonica Group]|uniref:Os06g0621700 protein n=1 Tax=Oryza sativa subsp. japonica TaxID=39947 RepID=A0A0P0WYS7_ORYSJ|nr:Os06g0621700 [Oryza sativa Japonica Group]
MLHHHISFADMWDPYTGIPRRPSFMRRRPRHIHRQLLLTPRSPPPLPATPLAPSQPPSPLPAPLAPSRPPLPSTATLCAKPVSDPSTERCRACQKQPSPTPSASRPRLSCLR